MDVITFPVNRLTTSGLLTLLHGVISLSDAASCDNEHINIRGWDQNATNAAKWQLKVGLYFVCFKPSKYSPFPRYRKYTKSNFKGFLSFSDAPIKR